MPAADSVLWRHLDDLDDDRQLEAAAPRELDRTGYDIAARTFWARCPRCSERTADHRCSSAAFRWLLDHDCPTH